MRTVQPGEVIAGKYVVQGIIGRGGVGIIAAARHVTLKQLVALKFLRPEIAADPEVMQRFVREAQATAQIRSEHVARVMDAGTLEDGTIFLVFEHLAGRDLAQVLREDGPLAMADAVDYLTQACEAIAEAHALGIVHRDLKPANLFLTRAPDGAPFVKVLDFGLSKFNQSALTALTALTAENHVIGSPHFMSPEQMRSSRDADVRSDIWALGVVLFGLLTGRVPFEGQFLPEVCAAILGGKPLSLLELRPDLPAALEAVILHCLRAKPEERIQTVPELAEALLPFTPAHARARAARIARVAEGAKRTLATSASPSSALPAVDAPASEGQAQCNDASEKLLGARKSAQHGPSPVSWSISVGQARASLAVRDAGADALPVSPAFAKRPTPPAVRTSAVASSPPGHAVRARRRRTPVLVATAAFSLLLGTTGTLWLGHALPYRSSASASGSALSVAEMPPMTPSLSASVRALRTSAPPSQPPPAASAAPVAPLGVLPSPRPSTARKASEELPMPAIGGGRGATKVRRAAPRPALSSKPGRPLRDEELILGMPH
jgi:serine/threonine-protein kinase